VYEHCGKTTLKNLADKKYEFSEEAIKRILFQILLGLEFLYSKNMFHGNLSTSTIHINENGKIKLSLIYYS
jgi:serine/threonine protein kinase